MDEWIKMTISDFHAVAQRWPVDISNASAASLSAGVRGTESRFRKMFRNTAGWTDRTGNLRRSIRRGNVLRRGVSRRNASVASGASRLSNLEGVTITTFTDYGSKPPGGTSYAYPVEFHGEHLGRAIERFDFSVYNRLVEQNMERELAKSEGRVYRARRII